MIAYVDASVLLRFVFRQAQPLREWHAISRVLSSQLIRVESLRAIDRSGRSGVLDDHAIASSRGQLLEQLGSFELVPLDVQVLTRAEGSFPTKLGTLDALHLSTALLLREQLDDLTLATHDEELATAARALGFDVYGV